MGRVDALSELLKSVRLEGAVYLEAEFTAPWCVQARYGLASVKRRLAGADHVVFFHYFAEGGGLVALEHGTQMEVHPGDFVLFSRGDHQRMGSDLRLPAREAATFTEEEARAAGGVIRIRHGGGGALTRLVCGYLACNHGVAQRLFDAMPRVVRMPVATSAASRLMAELLHAGVAESGTEGWGADSMRAKLAELMFVEAIRRYVQELPAENHGWLAGLRDAQVGRALSLLHGQPKRSWSLDSLAREAGLSRSVLAERFTALVGEPPIQYLTRWRLAQAAQALRASGQPIARIAQDAGYESDAAFNRAFKREFGRPPAEFRRAKVIRERS
jgi:AraC-like DNA-binding protein